MILTKIEKGDEGRYKIQFPENVTLCDIIEMQTALTYALAKLDNSGEEETHSYYLNLLAELFRLPEKKIRDIESIINSGVFTNELLHKQGGN